MEPSNIHLNFAFVFDTKHVFLLKLNNSLSGPKKKKKSKRASIGRLRVSSYPIFAYHLTLVPWRATGTSSGPFPSILLLEIKKTSFKFSLT